MNTHSSSVGGNSPHLPHINGAATISPSPEAGSGPAGSMSRREVAEYLRVSERTIYDYEKKLGLPFFRTGGRDHWYDKSRVDQWLARIKSQGA